MFGVHSFTRSFLQSSARSRIPFLHSFIPWLGTTFGIHTRKRRQDLCLAVLGGVVRTMERSPVSGVADALNTVRVTSQVSSHDAW